LSETLFSTNEVAAAIGADRMAFYEWAAKGYIMPVHPSKARGQTALFDLDGLVAAAIFEKLRHIVRRPAAGDVSYWYQTHGKDTPDDNFYVYVLGDRVICGSAKELRENEGISDITITISHRSIRQWIATRLKEIRADGHPKDQPD
jgi:hypothetical protein